MFIYLLHDQGPKSFVNNFLQTASDRTINHSVIWLCVKISHTIRYESMCADRLGAGTRDKFSYLRIPWRRIGVVDVLGLTTPQEISVQFKVWRNLPWFPGSKMSLWEEEQTLKTWKKEERNKIAIAILRCGSAMNYGVLSSGIF